MLSHRNPAYLPEGNAITAEGEMRGARDSLPAIWCPRDLALLIILIIVFVSDLRGMQFAGNAIFFYWGLAFVTLQVPSLYVLSWLTHQAPRRVPIAIWLLHFVPERLRSVLFFLLWWCFNLVMLAALGACFTFLQAPLAPWSGIPAVQYLAFILLLGGATLLLMLPARLFKAALWIGGLCYLTAFALIVLAAVVFLIGHHQATGTLPLPTLTFFPAHFSWALFGLALLSLIGLNAPLLLDGEMRGPQRFLRGSAGYLYWGGLGSFGLILMLTAAWVLVKEVTPIEGAPSLAFIAPALGSWALPVTWLLLFLGSFGGVLAYLLLFSRAFLLAARRGFLPRSFTRLTPSGIPCRAILVQSVLILCTAVVFLS